MPSVSLHSAASELVCGLYRPGVRIFLKDVNERLESIGHDICSRKMEVCGMRQVVLVTVGIPEVGELRHFRANARWHETDWAPR